MKTDLGDYVLPPFADWQKFERFCRDLWAELWCDTNAKCNGRNGQPQAGVDVYGYRANDGALCGVQCKRRGRNGVACGKISATTLRTEVDKAKAFQPPLRGEFILAHTGAPDEAIEEEARRITEEHKAAGLFHVHVCAWEDILSHLGDHTQVFRKHYASLFATLRVLDSDQSDSDDLASVHAAINRGAGQSARVPHLGLPEQLSLVDAECRAQIETIHAALKDGQARFALTQAEALRIKSTTNVSGETRAHVAILTGQAFLAIGDLKRAASSLLEAANLAPESAEVCAQVALGHSVAGNVKAVRTWAMKALSLSPCHMMAIQLAISVDERSDEEILEEYEPLVGARPEVFAVLGQRAVDRRDLATAHRWFERAIDVGGSHPELFVGTAQVLVGLVTEDAAKHVHETKTTRAHLTRAIELVECALPHVGDAESRQAKAHWYVTRIAAKQMLRAPDAAAAADEALALCGQVPAIVRVRAAIAADAGENERVVSLLDQLSEPLDIDDLGILAAALTNLGKYDRAAGAWKDILAHPNLAEHQRFQASLNHAVLLKNAGNESEARALVESAMDRAPGDLLPILVAVTLYERLEVLPRRDALLQSAVDACLSGSTYLLSLLADVLMRTERWTDAADVYMRALPNPVGDVYEQRLLRALFMSGRYASLLKRCDETEEAFGRSQFTAELRSAAYESLGDLESAIAVCRKFLDTDPNSHTVRLRHAAVLFRQGMLSDTAQQIDSLDFGAIRGLHGLSILAQTLAQLGRPQDAIEIAYRMRKEHIDDVEAHLRYVSIYMGVRHHLPEVNRDGTVTLGLAVQLNGPGAPGWILLCDCPQGNVSEKEYPSTHELSKLLVGKQVGARIRLPSVGAEWEVAAIDSKYGFANARTMECFPAHFPTNTRIQQQTIPVDSEGMVEHFRKQFEANNRWTASVLVDYHLGQYGIGSVASMLSRSVFDTISAILTTPGGVLSCTNLLDEQNHSLVVLSSSDVPLILDLTAIMALEHVGALRDGILGNRTLMVVQRTIDELMEEALKVQDPPPDGRMQIGLQGNQLVKHVTTAEEMRSVHQYFIDLVGWLRVNAKIAPIAPRIAEYYAPLRDMGTMIGQSFWDTIRAAASGGSVLVSDDLWLRRVAKTSLNVDGVCSAMLLMSEMHAGHLARSRYVDSITGLIALGYQRLPVDAAILEAAARLDQWQVGDVLRKALLSLQGPEMMAEAAVLVAARFIHKVWSSVGDIRQRTAFLVVVLGALVVGRDRNVLRWFLSSIRFSLSLHPQARDELIRSTNAWERTRVFHA